MENIVVFVITFAAMLLLFHTSVQTSISSVYSVVSALKEDIKEPVLAVEENGTLLKVENVGPYDAFNVRLYCWDINNPINRGFVVRGEINELLPPSIPVLTYLPNYREINYDLTRVGFTQSEINEGRVMCALVAHHYIKTFVVHG